MIDGYSPKPYVDPTQPVPLNTTVILVCRVVGVPFGRVLEYAWTCPGEECNIGGGRHPNRKTLGDTIVVNVISLDDSGGYVCSVTEEEGSMVFSVGSAEFNLTVEGKRAAGTFGGSSVLACSLHRWKGYRQVVGRLAVATDICKL